MVIGILMLVLIILLLTGMPIAFVLLTIGSVGIITIQGFDTLQGILATTAYRSVNSFVYSAIPLFVLMAHFISKSKIADELFDSVIKWVGHVPGGAGIATVLASAGFGTLSGSSVAATAAMSQIAIPQMMKANYSDSFSAGLVATSTGVLAAMIPPSVPLILYGIQTENSIGKLLVAGILPGLLIAFLLCLYIVVVSFKNKSKTAKASWKERFVSLKSIWPMVILVIFVLYIIYSGTGTATEAAAFGAFGALIIGLIMKRLNLKLVFEALMHTTKQTTMIFTIIIGAHVFSYYIAMTRVGNTMVQAIEESGFPAWGILILIIILYLIMGMFMDLIGTMLLTIPLVYPLIVGLGYDPIWFGIVLVLLLEIGLVTPPVGINLFITSEQSGISTGKVLRGSVPFISVLLVALLIIILFPQIALYLPSLM
ncbi:C4-dicarboxylate ABC transporter permease [Sporosarcina sp. P13]|uniref:TRAP transporter large permease n=1 Tax=Sporosarcina sp. P13 TaxID=2048263 RepID=UPI000C16CE09|nr:TRAP transporter large permease [Sporosarcina sp. P13]PIC64905.1 C4-dicarboxylate ABC transporter permease [Sporosarcina sp. P13]